MGSVFHEFEDFTTFLLLMWGNYKEHLLCWCR